MTVAGVIGEAWIDIRARTAKFISDADVKASHNAGKDLATALAAGVAAVKIFNFGQDAFRDFAEAERITRQTEAVLKSTGEAAGITADHIAELTARQMEKQVVDDEFVRAGANVLLTFTKIRNEVGAGNNVFDRATALAVDYAKATGGDAASAAQTFGIALNAPADGLARLSRLGIRFTADQQAVIDKMIATGDVLGAQKLILTELETRYGGQAAAQATAADRMIVKWGEVKEELGGALLPVVNTLSNAGSALIDVWEGMGPGMQQVIVYGGGIALTSVAIAKGFEVASATLDSFRTIAATVSHLMTSTAAAEQALATATTASTSARAINTALVTPAAAAYTGLAAAEGEAAVAGTAATTAMSGALPVLAGIAALAAAAGVVYLTFRDSKDEVAEASKRVTKALIDETGAINLSTDATNNYIESTSRFSTRNQIDDLDKMGVSLVQLNAWLRDGQAGQEAFLAAAVGRGELKQAKGDIDSLTGGMRDAYAQTHNLIEVNGRWYEGNIDLIKSFNAEQAGLQKSAKAQLDSLVRGEQLLEAHVQIASAIHTLSDGSVDYAAVLQDLNEKVKADAEAKRDAADATLSDAEAAEFLSLAAARSADWLAVSASNAKDAASAAEWLAGAWDRAAATQSAALDKVTRQTYGAEVAQDKFAQSFEQVSTASGGAARDVEADARRMRDAAESVTAAQDDLADAIQRQQLIAAGPDENRVKLAEIEARRAVRDLAEANNNAVDAAEALARARADATPAAVAEAYEAATRQVASADRDAQRATLALADAQTKLSEARATGDVKEVRTAELDVADAQDRVFATSVAATRAHQALRSAQQLGASAARELQDAQRKVEAASDDVAVSADGVKKAEDELRAARESNLAGSPEMVAAAEAVKEAQDKVAEATQNVADIEAELARSRSGGSGSTAATKSARDAMHDLATSAGEYVKGLQIDGIPTVELQRDALAEVRDRLNEVESRMSPEEKAKAEKWWADFETSVKSSWPGLEQTAAKVDDILTFDEKALDEQMARIKADLDAWSKSLEPVSIPITATISDEDFSSVLADFFARNEIKYGTDLNANGIIGRASGGGVGAGTWSWVGEQGKELAYFGTPATIYPHDQSMAMAAAGGPTFMFNIEIGSVQAGADAYGVGQTIALSAYRALASKDLALSARKVASR